jgi:DNA-binding XRE family transcriptional regulator
LRENRKQSQREKNTDHHLSQPRPRPSYLRLLTRVLGRVIWTKVPSHLNKGPKSNYGLGDSAPVIGERARGCAWSWLPPTLGTCPRQGAPPKVRRLWRQQELTQEQLARRAGLNQGHLSQIESGARAYPSALVIKKLARALGVPVTALLE